MLKTNTKDVYMPGKVLFLAAFKMTGAFSILLGYLLGYK